MLLCFAVCLLFLVVVCCLLLWRGVFGGCGWLVFVVVVCCGSCGGVVIGLDQLPAEPLPPDTPSAGPPFTGQPKMSLFFFSLSLCIFSLNFGGVCEECTFGLLGCGVKPRRLGPDHLRTTASGRGVAKGRAQMCQPFTRKRLLAVCSEFLRVPMNPDTVREMAQCIVVRLDRALEATGPAVEVLKTELTKPSQRRSNHRWTSRSINAASTSQRREAHQRSWPSAQRSVFSSQRPRSASKDWCTHSLAFPLWFILQIQGNRSLHSSRG